MLDELKDSIRCVGEKDSLPQRCHDVIAAADALRDAAIQRDGGMCDPYCERQLETRGCRCGHLGFVSALAAYDAVRGER